MDYYNEFYLIGLNLEGVFWNSVTTGETFKLQISPMGDFGGLLELNEFSWIYRGSWKFETIICIWNVRVEFFTPCLVLGSVDFQSW